MNPPQETEYNPLSLAPWDVVVIVLSRGGVLRSLVMGGCCCFLGIFMPVGSAGMGGRRWWIRGYLEAALPLSILWEIFFVVLFFLLFQLATRS